MALRTPLVVMVVLAAVYGGYIGVQARNEGGDNADEYTANGTAFFKLTLPPPPVFFIPSFGWHCNPTKGTCRRMHSAGAKMEKLGDDAPMLVRPVQLPAPMPLFLPKGNAPNVTAFNTVNVVDDDKLIDVDLFEDSFGFGPSGLGEVIIVEPDTTNETDTVYNPITVVPKPPQPKFYNAFLERKPIEFLVDFIIEQDIGRNNPRIEKREAPAPCCIDDIFHRNLSGLIPHELTLSAFPGAPGFKIFFTGKTPVPRIRLLPRSEFIPLHVPVPFSKKKLEVKLDFPSFGLDRFIPDFRFKEKPVEPHPLYEVKLERKSFRFRPFSLGIDDFNPVPPRVNLLNIRTKAGSIIQDVKFIERKPLTGKLAGEQAHIHFPAFQVVDPPILDRPPPPASGILHFNTHIFDDTLL